jgi:hypothetical protein
MRTNKNKHFHHSATAVGIVLAVKQLSVRLTVISFSCRAPTGFTMGQAQSIEAVEPAKPATASEAAKAKKKGLKIPSEWKNDADFRIVSPVSDISNPSQFRGRIHNNNTAAGGTASRVRHHRTSKVCAKQRPPTGLPLPASFYFQSGKTREESPSSSIDSPKKATEEAPNEASNQAKGGDVAKRSLMETWKAKCMKAKQQLGDCFQDHKNVNVVGDPLEIRHYTQRVESIDDTDEKIGKKIQKVKEDMKPYLQFDQFQPVWKEADNHQCAALQMLHSEEEYVQRLSSKHSPGASSPDRTPVDSVGDTKNQTQPTTVDHTHAPSQLPSVTVSLDNASYSPVQGRALSLTSSQQVSTRSMASSTIGTESAAPTVLQSRPPVRPASSFQSNGSTISTVIQHQKPLDVFRTKTSSVPFDLLQRASIGRSMSHESTGTFDQQRKSVQEQVQRQIDEQQENSQGRKPLSRVERLRQQFLEQVEEQKAQNIVKTQICPSQSTKEDALQFGMEESTMVSVAEKRKKFEKHHRSSSVPGRSSQEAQLPSKPPIKDTRVSIAPAKQHRSVSAPRTRQSMETTTTRGTTRTRSSRGRQSVDGSALLKLSGWQQKPPPNQPLPALLQLTGWKKDSLPERKQQQPNKKRLSTQSEPVKKKTIVAPPAKAKVRASEPSRPAPLLEESRTLPRREPPNKKKGRTIALMLQQAYFDYSDEEDGSHEKIYRSFAKPTVSPLVHIIPGAMVECSPALSVDSTDTTGSVPMVSQQAIFNADFLFAKASMEKTVMPKKEDGTGFTINTLESRSRMTAISHKPVNIPSSAAFSYSESFHSKYRRVRFSDDVSADDNNAIPAIESKLSDLTESTAGRESHASTRSSLSIPRIDSIPEEDEEEGTAGIYAEQVSMATSRDQPAVDEDDQDIKESESLNKPAVMRWSYRTEDGLMQGVTPLVSGKSTSRITKSPSVRFMHAKDKFNGNNNMPSKEGVSKKVSPVKRSSPVKRASLVSSRIAAMEGRRARSEGGVTRVMLPIKVRRNTTGDDALAPRKSTLQSPLLQRFIERANNINLIENSDTKHAARASESPMMIDGSVVFARDRMLGVNMPAPKAQNSLDDSSSVNSDESEDVFGAILQPTTLEEETSGDAPLSVKNEIKTHSAVPLDDSDDSEMDAFEKILSFQPSMDDGENSIERLVSDVAKQGEGQTPKSLFSHASSQGDTASFSSTLFKQDSIATNEEENLIPSYAGRFKAKSASLGFQEGGHVKPNEQLHRAVPGSGNLSSMQRTPLQARTWRALAAAAQEKDTKHSLFPKNSLLNIHPNTVGR